MRNNKDWNYLSSLRSKWLFTYALTDLSISVDNVEAVGSRERFSSSVWTKDEDILESFYFQYEVSKTFYRYLFGDAQIYWPN